MIKKVVAIFKFSKEVRANYVKTNLLFIFVLLNIWDFAVNRLFFNGMVLGLIMFGPTAFLWLIGTLRAIALIILISIFEFMVTLIFIAEGFELGGASLTLKSIFWLPYLILAGFNSFWGLKIYTEYRESRIRNPINST